MTALFRSYRDLEVWQKAMAFAQQVYNATSNFPTEEKFGLASQMRRAAVSIPSNLAEGHARSGSGEFQHFISMAMGSVAELETQVLLSAALGYLAASLRDELLTHLNTIGKMLRGLQKSLRQRSRVVQSPASSPKSP